ncbi:MAG: hypothetical protein QHD01_02800 [Bradyrhizobium sp.]|nr:hypothetical protein [Bradyrhizobium sp.]MDX3965513.1 hypothetical protein [Bradyrhizobium sp.]
MLRIREEHERRRQQAIIRGADLTLEQVFAAGADQDDDSREACAICTI